MRCVGQWCACGVQIAVADQSVEWRASGASAWCEGACGVACVCVRVVVECAFRLFQHVHRLYQNI